MEQNQPQVIVVEKKGNGLGTAGFVLSIVAFVLCWVPILNWILWLLGLIFSFIGVFKPKKGLAIAGLVISCIWLIAILVFFGAVLASM